MQKGCIKIRSPNEFEITEWPARLANKALTQAAYRSERYSDIPHLHDYQVQITLKEAGNFSKCII